MTARELGFRSHVVSEGSSTSFNICFRIAWSRYEINISVGVRHRGAVFLDLMNSYNLMRQPKAPCSRAVLPTGQKEPSRRDNYSNDDAYSS